MPISGVSNSPDKCPLADWAAKVCRAAERLGHPVTNSKHYGWWMREAGFVDIVERHFYWPLNTRLPDTKQRLIGICARRNLLDGVEAMSMALLTRSLKWTRWQVEEFLTSVRDDLMYGGAHCYVDM
jgi:hypothetical protein